MRWARTLPLLVLCMVGCAARPGAGHGTTAASGHAPPLQQSSASDTSAAGAESVRPGVNERYFEPGAADTWTDVFEGESREVFRHRDAIVERLGLRAGMVVGDIGAGTGLFTLPLARAVGEGGRVLAVDIVPAFLERVAARAAEAKLPQVTPVLGAERETKLEDSSLDLAFLCNVYHHIEYPGAYMRSVRAALRPGASLVVVDFERIEGVTSAPMLKHVRAPRQTVIAEITAAGFVLEREDDFLTENYYLVFRRP